MTANWLNLPRIHQSIKKHILARHIYQKLSYLRNSAIGYKTNIIRTSNSTTLLNDVRRTLKTIHLSLQSLIRSRNIYMSHLLVVICEIAAPPDVLILFLYGRDVGVAELSQSLHWVTLAPRQRANHSCRTWQAYLNDRKRVHNTFWCSHLHGVSCLWLLL